MAKPLAAKGSSRDPLKTIADALDTAVKAAKVGTADAKKAADNAFPAAGRFLSRFVYTTSYTFSYGVVFPTIMIAKSIPTNNAVVNGFVDGARAASGMVDQLKHRQLESSDKPLTSRSRSLRQSGRPQTDVGAFLFSVWSNWGRAECAAGGLLELPETNSRCTREVIR